MASTVVQLRMGKYSSRKNVANKDYKTSWVTGVFENMTVFGEFNIKNPVFYLDTLYDVNYGYFTYNGIRYYGYIDVSTRTKGGYLYTFTIDGLATAYHNGCLSGSRQMIAFGPRGRSTGNVLGNVANQMELDTRLKTLDTPTIITKNVGHDPDDLAIVVVTSQPTLGPKSSSTTPATGVYVMTPSAYGNFILKLGQAGTVTSDDGAALIPDFSQKLMESILNVYAMPLSLVPTALRNQTSDVVLTMIEDLVLGLATAIRTYTIKVTEGTVWAIASNATDVTGNKYTTSVSGLSPLTPSSFHGRGQIVIPDAGTLNFSPDMLGVTSISTIGYSTYVDFSGGKCSYYLNVNGSDYNDIYFTSSFPIQVPIAAYDYNLTKLIPKITQGASSAFNTSPSKGKAGIAADVLMGSINLASEVINNTGAYSVTGVTGGTTTLTSKKYGYFKFIYYQQWAPNDFETLYGKPANQIIDLGSADDVNVGNGYVKTVNCDLPLKGLPRFVIDEANAVLDSGAFIGQVNMPD